MPSFRSARSQARHQAGEASAIGTAKPAAGATEIHSLGTQRTYAVSLSLLGEWARAQRLGTALRALPEDIVARWLDERAESVGQKALDNDRQAIRKALGYDFPRLRSNHVAERSLATESRAYTAPQIARIAASQTPRNAFATRLAAAAGLRAQELLTLRRAEERPATGQRDWSDTRFLGLDGVRYTVVGKGGLIREVMLPEALAAELEQTRRDCPKSVRDREINYLSHYDVAGGLAWSKSFSEASQRALGYSVGAHGLRHGYAQNRLDHLQQRGLRYAAALGIVSQELGHFRPDITEVYLR